MTTEEIPTLSVPAAYYDEALAFCNDRRAEDGKPPIDALPPGECGMERSCPCGAATGVFVGNKVWSRAGYTTACLSAKHLIADGHPTGFVGYFDRHAPLAGLVLPIRDESLHA